MPIKTSQGLNRMWNFYTLLVLSKYDYGEARDRLAVLDGYTTADVPLVAQGEEVRRLVGKSAKELSRTFLQIRRSFRLLPADTEILALGDEEYPAGLAQINNPPPYLFVRGNRDLLARPGVAVVGTRSATPEGKARARKLAALLAHRGIVVVSGLAKGIDAVAHKGALEAAGDTMAVIGTPIHRTYPKEHEDLQERIATDGLVLSQFAPFMSVRRFFFPMRNEVMSGLSKATVVIEASETSGALIQARQALAQGRRLFIPRTVARDPHLAWPNELLKHPHAAEFSSVDYLLGRLHIALGLASRQEKHALDQTVRKVSTAHVRGS